MKNYMLTDFNTERWRGINIESVILQVENLKERINKDGYLIGGIGKPGKNDMSLSGASHLIKNITFRDGKIYGDVEFLNNENGKKAENLIENMNFRFELKGVGIYEQREEGDGEKVIHSIITWDVIDD